MSECFRAKFLLNSIIMDCKEFNSDLINEGKSLYEVIRIIDEVPLFLEDHLERLFNSARVTNLTIWLIKDEIQQSIRTLCKVNSISEGNVKIVFNFNETAGKNFAAYFVKHNYPTEDVYLDGVKTSSYRAERKNPNAKVINKSLREITDDIIEKKQVYEVILIDNDGNITEGSRSNVFMVKENKIYTAPKEDVLLGITRKYVFEACRNLSYSVIEDKFSFSEIESLDGMFLCGTSPKVLPIASVDNIKLNSSNKVLQEIRLEYNRLVENYISTHK